MVQRHRVRAAIDAYLASDVDHGDDMAAAYWLSDIVVDPDLGGFLRWRCRAVESLIGEIRAAVRADASVAVIPSVARPTAGGWYEPNGLMVLSPAAFFLIGFFIWGLRTWKTDQIEAE